VYQGATGNMENNSTKLIKRLKKDGWKLLRVSGSHHIFQHPDKAKTITLTHPRKDVSPGLVRSVYRDAGW
jgi:predicted RNA binding protein YcfA (HicA-like mRNA interferase family)